MLLTDTQRQSIQTLYEQELYLQAWEKAQAIGPLESWEGRESLILAGRLAGNLGDDLLARRLHTRAYRRERTHPTTRYYYGRQLLGRFGPLAAWRWMRRTHDPLSPHCTEADWLSMAAVVAASLRDFETAELLCTRAAALTEEAWYWVERAQVLESADRYDEALVAARRSLEQQPYFRAGVTSVAHLLLLLARDDDAQALLEEAHQKIESYAVSSQLALLHYEARNWTALHTALDQLEALAPLLTNDKRRWFQGIRSECAYFQGDVEGALTALEGITEGFYALLAEHLRTSQEQGLPHQSVLLPVGFVRQHHMTCAPATLTALSQFFGKPAEHLDIVEEICYDGTPGHSERRWAERSGYQSHEFTLTWEVARALLDRGLPFTLATVATGSAHLQAVVGYDLRRQSLFLRDPYHRTLQEALATELIEQQAPTGPRAHLLLPPEKAALLEGIALPEAALWDTYNGVQVALVEHRRADAVALLSTLPPDHRLTLMARRSLAHYDGSTTELLACTEALLERYPTEPNWQLARLAYLQELSRQEERLATLDTLCEAQGPGTVAFWEMKARELLLDFRRLPETEALLRRVLGYHPTGSSALLLLAGLRWSQRRWDDALELYRFAACTDDKSEHNAHAYFQALQWRGRAQEGIAFLQQRFARLGGRSALPGRTLYEALWELDRHADAKAVLAAALERRPDDTELLLFSVVSAAREGRFADAHPWLDRARTAASEYRWLTAAANLARAEGDSATEEALALQLVALDPLAVTAQRVVAQARSRQGGPEAAIAYLEEVVARFPYHLALNQLLEGWLQQSGEHEKALAVLDRIRSAHPGDLWTQRERAVVCGWHLHQPERGLAEIDEALRIHPNDPASHSIRGALLQTQGRHAEARAAWKTAVELDADYAEALRRLVSSGEDRAERRSALRLVIAELVRQPVRGDSIATLVSAGGGSLSPEELLEALRPLHTARPDLWQTWDVLADHLRSLGQLAEAEQVIQGGIERFPLLPKLHITHATVLQAQGRVPEAIVALQRAREIRPDSQLANRTLSEVFLETGRADEAVAVLQAGLRRNPQDDYLIPSLAFTLWTIGRYDEALAHLRQALLLDSDSEWTWERLREWSLQRGQADAAVTLIRELVQKRPSDATLWLRLAQLLPSDAFSERLAALDKALALSPRLVDAHDERVQLLTQAERFADARTACAPLAFPTPPRQLQARAAWVTAESGDLPKALIEIQALVEREPEYAWAWSLTAEWARTVEDFSLYERAAQRLTRLTPDQAMGWGYLGHAKLKNQDTVGAKDAFRRAHQLAPGYTYAGTNLLRLHADAGEAAEVEAVLAALIAAQPTDLWVRAHGVRAQAKLGKHELARTTLEALLCQTEVPGQDFWGPVRFCQSELEALKLTPLFEKALTHALELPEVRNEVLTYQIRHLCNTDRWDTARALALRTKAPIRARALSSYAVALAEHGKAGALDFIQEHAATLATDDLAWGNIAHAYETLEELDKGIAWTDDWKQRAAPQPWMLLNRVDALRARGREAEAIEVSRFALTLPPDYTRGWHALWLAFDAACAGKETAAFLAEFEISQQEGFFVFLAGLVRTLERGRQGAGFGELRKSLIAGLGETPSRPLRPFERRLLRRTGEALAKSSPHLLVKLWCLWLRLVGAP